jgi:hypothetical protein
MTHILAVACLIFSAGLIEAQVSAPSKASPPVVSRLQPSPQVNKLLDAFAGDWSVSESFEVSATEQSRTRQGSCTIRETPGFSMLEECKTNGSAGELRFMAILWWDPNSEAYQFFNCFNQGGCALRGTAHWEGSNLVNAWEEEEKGKKVAYKDSFVDITRESFRLVSEGVSDGVPVWRVITKYARQNGQTARP